MHKLIVLVFLFITTGILAQNKINQTDSQGRKQGAWVKKDVEGKLIYQATFKDDKPVGEMKRFHPNGVVKAILNFTEEATNRMPNFLTKKGETGCARENMPVRKNRRMEIHFRRESCYYRNI